MTGKRKMKVLVIASVASMHDNFNRENINILLDMGCDVTVAANFHTGEDINSQEKIDGFVKEMRAGGVHIVQVDFTRKTGNIRQQMKSAGQVGKLLEQRFDIVHCHSPICAALTRANYRRHRKEYGGKLVYTAHGFHFYKGAPLKNWLLYYPVEWLCSWWTDVLVTINREDYRRAKRKFHAKKTVYVPGVGVDTEKFKPDAAGRERKRAELGLKETDIMLLSVGELNQNKNHAVVIRALGEMNNKNLHYYIAGQGVLKEELLQLADSLKIHRQVYLLGYRTDVSELMQAADIYVLPSIREGLNVSLMEAMASGLPCIVSRIRGNTDLVQDEKCLAEAIGMKEWKRVLENMTTNLKNREYPYGEENRKWMNRYDISRVNRKMKQIYGNVPEGRI